jgi:2-keto-4-pentenoate hydratase/2-oxohepta-3-ene-1,7-dioic acid hydratase in catechol pathway
MGPTVTTKDEISDVKSVCITTTLNGQVMQSATMEDLIFDIGQLIEYYSQFYQFRPGDILTTGSPPGVGHGRKPPLYMRDGDLEEVHVDAIGTLSNPVLASAKVT